MWDKRTQDALKALYSKEPLKTIPKTPKLKKSLKTQNFPTEDQEQMRLFRLALDHPLLSELLVHIANEGKRSVGYAIKLLNMGLRPGVSDLFLPVARKGYHGFWIELKRIKGGRVTPEQWSWIEKMRAQGYRAEVAYGCDDAWNMLIDYLQK